MKSDWEGFSLRGGGGGSLGPGGGGGEGLNSLLWGRNPELLTVIFFGRFPPWKVFKSISLKRFFGRPCKGHAKWSFSVKNWRVLPKMKLSAQSTATGNTVSETTPPCRATPLEKAAHLR